MSMGLGAQLRAQGMCADVQVTYPGYGFIEYACDICANEGSERTLFAPSATTLGTQCGNVAYFIPPFATLSCVSAIAIKGTSTRIR